MYTYSSLHTDSFVVHAVSNEARVALVLWCLVVHHCEHSIGTRIDSLGAQIKILQMIVIMPVEYQEATYRRAFLLADPET